MFIYFRMSQNGTEFGGVSEAPVGLYPLLLSLGSLGNVVCDERHALEGAASVCAVQQDAVDAGDGAPTVFALVVPDVFGGNAESLQTVPYLALVFLQILLLCQVQWVQLKHLCGFGEVDVLQPLAGHHLLQAAAFGWMRLQYIVDQSLARLGDPRRHRERTIQDAALQFSHGIGTEWHGARHYEEQHYAQSPDVHIHTHVVLVTEQLGRRIRRGTTQCAEGLVTPAHCAETKIAHLQSIMGNITIMLISVYKK